MEQKNAKCRKIGRLRYRASRLRERKISLKNLCFRIFSVPMLTFLNLFAPINCIGAPTDRSRNRAMRALVGNGFAHQRAEENKADKPNTAKEAAVPVTLCHSILSVTFLLTITISAKWLAQFRLRNRSNSIRSSEIGFGLLCPQPRGSRPPQCCSMTGGKWESVLLHRQRSLPLVERCLPIRTKSPTSFDE